MDAKLIGLTADEFTFCHLFSLEKVDNMTVLWYNVREYQAFSVCNEFQIYL